MKKNKIFNRILSNIEPEFKREVSLNIRIANRIAEILTEKGITQRDFASRMHKNESEISRWLTGSHGFTTTTLSKIETVLGESIIEIKEPRKSEFVMFPSNHYDTIRSESGNNVISVDFCQRNFKMDCQISFNQ